MNLALFKLMVFFWFVTLANSNVDTLKFIHLLKLSIAHSIINIKRGLSTIIGSNNDAEQTDERLNL